MLGSTEGAVHVLSEPRALQPAPQDHHAVSTSNSSTGDKSFPVCTVPEQILKASRAKQAGPNKGNLLQTQMALVQNPIRTLVHNIEQQRALLRFSAQSQLELLVKLGILVGLSSPYVKPLRGLS